MKTFILIMGAGRCGTTSLVSFLNKQENFNIYGENNCVIYDLLHSVKKIQEIKQTKKEELDKKYSYFSYRNKQHIGTEWYNPKNKIDNLEKSLLNIIINYFDNVEEYVGFKEVRWKNQKLDCFNILEKYFHVKYIFLTRNIYDQTNSIQKLGWELSDPPKEHIEKTNKHIEFFLSTKPKNQYIIKNITINKNFLREIYEFIVADAKKKSS